jgi:hypothetical protein
VKLVGVYFAGLSMILAASSLALAANDGFGADTMLQKVERAVTSLTGNSSVRIVPRKNGHTLAFNKGAVLFDGRRLSLLSTILEWKAVLGSGSDCGEDDSPPIVCKWEHLGIEVGTGQSSVSMVKFVTVHLQSEAGDFLSDAARSGKSEKKLPSYIVNGYFSGNLELEGYRLDQETTFNDVQKTVRGTLNLNCDIRDCRFPHGSFNNVANIYFELNGGSVRSTINSISISAVE